MLEVALLEGLKMDDLELTCVVVCMAISFMMQFIVNSGIHLFMLLSQYDSLRQPVPKVQGFYEVLVPQMNPRIHRRYFRMYNQTMRHLTFYLLPLLRDSHYYMVAIGKKVAMTCAYLGTSVTTIQLAHMFGVSEHTFLNCTEEVLDAMIARLPQVIRWPEQNELAAYAAEYNTIGRAIDDVHLEIQLTEERRRRRGYFCWKHYYSIHLQAVATYDLHFLDVFVGWPGQSHDARVFRMNPLYHTLPAHLRDRQIHRLSETYHILGDSAFPLSAQVLTPFRNRDNLNVVERKYNRNLSSKRSNVERAFGLLLLRFPRLNKLNQKSLLKKIKVLLTACFLHNLCILEKDNINFYLARVQQMNFPQLNQQYRPLGTRISSRLGVLKRLQMANIIFVN